MSNKISNIFFNGMQSFASNRHVETLRDGMILALAPTLVGSFFLILRFLPISAWTTFMDSSPIGNYLLYPVVASMDMVGIIVLLGISYRLAESYKLEPLGAQVTALMCYMVVTPLQIFVNIPEQAQQLAIAGVPIPAMGTKGLFLAMLVGMVSVEIYRKIIEVNWVITMPDTVPPAVAKSFMAIIPTLFAMIIMLVVRVFFENTSYGSIAVFIEKSMSGPLSAGVKSFSGTVSYSMIYSIFWSMGVHGAVTDSVYIPIWTIINDENRIAFQQGIEQMPNMLTQPYLGSMTGIGGTSATSAFVVLSLWRAKSTHLKQVSKLALGPAIFQINEPIIFGVPVVLNPVMMLPFIIIPGILAANTYLWVYFGLAPRPTGVIIPWTTPSIFNVYLLTNGNFRAIILQVVNFVIALICYYPFFKIIDQDCLLKERSNKVY